MITTLQIDTDDLQLAAQKQREALEFHYQYHLVHMKRQANSAIDLYELPGGMGKHLDKNSSLCLQLQHGICFGEESNRNRGNLEPQSLWNLPLS